MKQPDRGRSKSRYLAAAALILGCLQTTACDTGGPTSARRHFAVPDDAVAVQMDTSASGASAPALAYQVRRRIGTEVGDERYMFNQIQGGVLLSDGFAVGDRLHSQVRLFSFDGQFVRGFGRVGEGPGEFRSLRRLVGLAGDTLLVYDDEIERISLFSRIGHLIGTYTPPWKAAGLAATEFYSAGDRTLAVIRQPHDPRLHVGATVRDSVELVWLTGKDSMQATGIHVADRWWSFSVGRGAFHARSRPSGAFVLVALSVSEIFVIGNDSPELFVFPATREVAGGGTVPAQYASVKGLNSPTALVQDDAVYDQLVFDHRDALWLSKANTERQLRLWWRVSEEGRVEGTLMLPANFRMLDARGDTLLIAETDSLGVERVDLLGVH